MIPLELAGNPNNTRSVQVRLKHLRAELLSIYATPCARCDCRYTAHVRLTVDQPEPRKCMTCRRCPDFVDPALTLLGETNTQQETT